MTRIPFSLVLLGIWGASCGALDSLQARAEVPRIPVLFDTDLGTDVDDAFALGLLLASPEIEVRGITTSGRQAEDRAWMVGRFLTQVGRTEVPVAWGRDPQAPEDINWQIQYRRHAAVVWNRTAKPVPQDAVEFLYEKLKAEPGKITLLPIGPLTNIARLLEKHPEAKPWIKQIVLMGGSVRVGYDGKPPISAEWNIRGDIKAAQVVFSSGIPLVVAPLDATTLNKLEQPLREKLFAACTPLTWQLKNLYQLWEQETPTLYDPVAVALVFNESFCKLEPLHLTVDEEGFTRIGSGEPNARVATSIDIPKFLNWYVERVAALGERSLPDPPGNVSQLVKQGGLPSRVHVFEDYETEIEKRWWMSGKRDSLDLPPVKQTGGVQNRFVCRSVITQDFDDLMGNTRTAYSGVVFNPVPGPPMGKHTRLSFRYKLIGTDQLRIQLYSLSRGFHRYLSLHGLPQNQWNTATVDLTQMRRPDGSGGPLSEDERIDDIQFYVDPRADVLIDEIVLYDAAPAEEVRPFPKRILFTGWFDTGSQGKEWPGDFEIVPHDKPRTWDAARAVVHPQTRQAWLRVSLRGPRKLDHLVRLRFQYRLTKGKSLTLILNNTESKARYESKVEQPQQGTWTEAFVDFEIPENDRELSVDELLILTDPGAELLVDDLLLYVPGEPVQ